VQPQSAPLGRRLNATTSDSSPNLSQSNLSSQPKPPQHSHASTSHHSRQGSNGAMQGSSKPLSSSMGKEQFPASSSHHSHQHASHQPAVGTGQGATQGGSQAMPSISIQNEEEVIDVVVVRRQPEGMPGL
jgi:hypothetical protein